MNLYRIYFRHYSQKDSKRGTETFLLAESDEQVMAWMTEDTQEYFPGWEYLTDEDTGCVYKGEDWLQEHPDMVDRAKAMGLTVDEWGDIEGPMKTLILFNRGEVRDPTDLYYGETQWFWELVATDIIDEDAEVLERLGMLCRA